MLHKKNVTCVCKVKNKMYFILSAVVLLSLFLCVCVCLAIFFRKKGYLQHEINNIEVIAHRGTSGSDLPENSLAAIRNSLALGVDAIEVDVRLTKDGELIVCHDAKIDRTTNGTGSVADHTLQELREYKIVDKNGNLTDEPLPMLGEVLEIVGGRCKLLVEAKRDKNAEQVAKVRGKNADEIL